MRIRVVGAVVAVLLAIAGGIVLTLYVASADRRAQAGAEFVDVYVVTEPILRGTPAEEIDGDVIERTSLPLLSVNPDRVTSLSQIAGLVATADLLPGEQLLRGRFSDQAALAVEGDVAVPPGMQEFSIALTIEEAAGGTVTAGSRVGIVVTANLDVVLPDGTLERQSTTSFLLHKVLVTRVQQGLELRPNGAENEDPVAMLIVTVALPAADVERVVWAAEARNDNQGGVWLTLEPDEAMEDDTPPVTADSVFR